MAGSLCRRLGEPLCDDPVVQVRVSKMAALLYWKSLLARPSFHLSIYSIYDFLVEEPGGSEVERRRF